MHAYLLPKASYSCFPHCPFSPSLLGVKHQVLNKPYNLLHVLDKPYNLLHVLNKPYNLLHVLDKPYGFCGRQAPCLLTYC